ncbi:MAG TPA: DUF6265 family protein [Fimbriimonadaceae bacterium]|nr:DUF6265 family protein [Fimbriimonadaceae bacterium]
MADFSTRPCKARCEDVAWFEGHWSGERNGEPVEEYWSAPAAASMMGMFRWIRDGAVRFFEILTVEESGEGLVLRVKHFHPGLKGWEEKDESAEFDLVDVAGRRAVWLMRGREEPLWLLFVREEDRFIVWFEKANEAVAESSKFAYRRV